MPLQEREIAAGPAAELDDVLADGPPFDDIAPSECESGGRQCLLYRQDGKIVATAGEMQNAVDRIMGGVGDQMARLVAIQAATDQGPDIDFRHVEGQAPAGGGMTRAIDQSGNALGGVDRRGHDENLQELTGTAAGLPREVSSFPVVAGEIGCKRGSRKFRPSSFVLW